MTLISIASPASRVQRRRRLPAAFTAIGGAIVVAGVLLPWLTLFAGLQRYTGLAGLNGRLLLVGGVLAIVLGAFATVRRGATILRVTSILGAIMAGFTAWLIVGVVETVHRYAANPMTIARPGPGLFVIAVGAVIVALAPLFRPSD